jgi:hypothetical protein
MRRIAEFRAKWHAPRGSSQDRVRQSLRRRIWWIAGTVLTAGVLAAPGPSVRFGSAPSFESPPVGSRSTEHFVSIRNSGLASLTIDAIRISGDGAEDFLPGASDCANRVVPAGRGCVVGVFFAPHREGRRDADLVVTSDDVVAPAHLVLTAIASTRTDFRVEPARIAFGDQRVGTASNEQATRISTLLNTPLRIREAHIIEDANGEFEVGSNTCTDALPKGGTCAVGVSFHPRMAGQRTGQLELLDDSGDAPHEVTLTGRGTAAELSLEPEQLSFPATQREQRSEQESVQVRNSGDDDVHLGAVALGGDAAGDFVLDKGSCESATLRPGAACEIRAQFEPMATGSRTATISLGDDAPDGPHTIRLVGTGTEGAKPSVQIYARSYSFGRQAVHTMSKPVQVWVVSRGKAPLTIGTVDFEGGRPRDFALRTGCSRRVLKPNDQCEIDVTFSPMAAGDARARILVPNDAADGQTYFDVDGIGIGTERGWCCLEGKIFEADENICRARGGRSYPDATTAKSQCTYIPVPSKAPQAEAPTGLEPGSPSLFGNHAIACESVTLRWNAAPAPSGYQVSIGRLVPGSDTVPRVVLSDHLFTNAYRVPSALEAGSYEWSVTSLGAPGQRNATAPPNYFLCAARTNVTGRPKVAALSNAKAKAASVISAPIQ